MEDQFADKFIQSPMMNSYETTPERHSSLSEPVSSFQSPCSSDSSTSFKTSVENSKMRHMTRLKGKGSSFAYRICDHVKMAPKFTETVKGKLSLGVRIIQEGGRQNIFRQIFGVIQGEELLKASQCYLSTTAGPIAGLLFISTEKIAFCSERSITTPLSTGKFIRTPYKVMIPIRKIQRANQSENVDKPAQKYIEIVTEDNFEFWFMGFLRYEKAFKNIQRAIEMANYV